MQFIKNVKKEDYIKFWENTPNNHFMQSYEWGQACAKNRRQIPYYVGLKDDSNKLVAVALLLKKKTPLNMCYFYVPRGFTLDYTQKNILTSFTEELKKFLKEENAIYLKIDPPIIYQEVDNEANKIEGGQNNYKLYNTLLNLGYKHKGFNKLYEGNQPRYTFRTYFNKYQTFEDVEKTFSKSFLKPLKRSYSYKIEVYKANEVKTFHNLIKIISERDGFHEYSYDYYQNVYTEFQKENHIKIYNVKINPSLVIKSLTTELENTHQEDRQNKLKKDITYFKEVLKKHPQEYTCASLICTYSQTGAWSLYIGNDEVATYTGTVNRLYYEFLKEAYENGYEYADLFGVVGDPHTKYKNLAGIFEYKRKIGGTCIEFIGEFDLINKPIWYHILPLLLKIYRKFKK